MGGSSWLVCSAFPLLLNRNGVVAAGARTLLLVIDFRVGNSTVSGQWNNLYLAVLAGISRRFSVMSHVHSHCVPACLYHDVDRVALAGGAIYI